MGVISCWIYKQCTYLQSLSFSQSDQTSRILIVSSPNGRSFKIHHNRDMSWFPPFQSFMHIINDLLLFLMIPMIEIKSSHAESFINELDYCVRILSCWASLNKLYPIVQTVLVRFLGRIFSESSMSTVIDSSILSNLNNVALGMCVSLWRDLATLRNINAVNQYKYDAKLPI